MKRKIEADARRRAPPKCIGAYEQHQEIGRGTYGTVYAGVRRRSSDSTGSNDDDKEPHGGADAQRVAIKKVLGRIDTGKREAAFLERCRGASHVVQVRLIHTHAQLIILHTCSLRVCLHACAAPRCRRAQ